MTPLPTLLRDACLAGLVLAIGGSAFGVGGTVAAGALGSILNLALLMHTVQARSAGLLGARMILKQLAGVGILYVLLATLPAGPVLIGFGATLLSLTVRAVAGAVRPPSLHLAER